MARVVDSRTLALQQQSTEIVTAHHVEPTADIKAERLRATFDGTELLYFLNGGKAKLEIRCVAVFKGTRKSTTAGKPSPRRRMRLC